MAADRACTYMIRRTGLLDVRLVILRVVLSWLVLLMGGYVHIFSQTWPGLGKTGDLDHLDQ
jgi:hypothetical protein